MNKLLVLTLIPLALGSDRHVLYTRTVVPPTWHEVGRASSHQHVSITLAVKQQNLDILEKKFWSVSDPKSRHWQRFMTPEEISAIVASKPEDMTTVKKWLLGSLSPDAYIRVTADAVRVRCSVADAEKLFATEIFIFAHDNGHTVLRSMGPHSVPTDVMQAIDLVEGIADFPMHRSPAKKAPKAGKKSSADIPLVVPQTLVEMYRVPPISGPSAVSQGPAEFQNDASYNQQDLQVFFEQTSLPFQNVSDIVGPYDGTYPDTEATLDTQYILAVGEKQVNWYWTAENWMYTYSHDFFNSKAVPDVVSISWGWAEDQQCMSGLAQSTCQTLGIDSHQYVARVNIEFQKIGLRGCPSSWPAAIQAPTAALIRCARTPFCTPASLVRRHTSHRSVPRNSRAPCSTSPIRRPRAALWALDTLARAAVLRWQSRLTWPDSLPVGVFRPTWACHPTRPRLLPHTLPKRPGNCHRRHIITEHTAASPMSPLWATTSWST